MTCVLKHLLETIDYIGVIINHGFEMISFNQLSGLVLYKLHLCRRTGGSFEFGGEQRGSPSVVERPAVSRIGSRDGWPPPPPPPPPPPAIASIAQSASPSRQRGQHRRHVGQRRRRAGSVEFGRRFGLSLAAGRTPSASPGASFDVDGRGAQFLLFDDDVDQ